MSTLQWVIVGSHVVGLAIGWFLKTRHVDIPSQYLPVIRQWLDAHHAKILSDTVSAVVQGNQSGVAK